MKHDDDTQALLGRIGELKRAKGALILAHTYQSLDVQDCADFTGDSLELSRKAAAAREGLIVFCGVRFMAETVKLLAPGKTVLLPRPDSGCYMADMATPEDVRRLRAEHPGVPVIVYVNSTAAVKAECDICCTSANAARVAASFPGNELVMLPDRNLAAWTARVTGKTVHAHQGCCPVHVRITAEDSRDARSRNPDARFLAHPECEPEVLALADEVLSTSGMLVYAAAHPEIREFLIATEATVAERLSREHPGRSFLTVGAAKYCVNMRKTTPQDVLRALETLEGGVEVDPVLAGRARLPIERMLALP